MKVGDLVRHPKGIENVCKETYAMGIILDTYRHSPAFARQIKVMWRGKQSHLLYYENQLEVISASR